MRKLLLLSVVAASVAAPAMAEVSVSGNVALTTDYHWRNVSQSNQDMAIQGGLDADFGNGFSLGTWASTVDFDNASDTNVELDIYGGYGFSAGGIDWGVGGIYYIYPDSEVDDLDFFELYVSAGKEFESGVSLGASLNWDPDNETIYGDVSVGYSITDAFSVDAGYGSYLEDNDLGLDGYDGFNVGGTYATPIGVDLDLRYYSNDTSGDMEDNVVFSISRSM